MRKYFAVLSQSPSMFRYLGETFFFQASGLFTYLLPFGRMGAGCNGGKLEIIIRTKITIIIAYICK